jgi:glycosyltransferase involved in cell wall biosynthesis
MKIAMIYYQFLDLKGTERAVGGIETYLTYLSQLCLKEGYEPVLFQCADEQFKRMVDGMTIFGVPCVNRSLKQKRQILYKAAMEHIDPLRDILIFGADHCSIPTSNPRCISIQHGVAWDLPTRYFCTHRMLYRRFAGSDIKKLFTIRKAIRCFENCSTRVCVDYNFLNWYKTIIPDDLPDNIWVIPNCAPIASVEEVANRKEQSENVSILFARRFEPYRGTRIMADAVKNLLASHSNVTFTFAGEGPDEPWLQERFAGEKRVFFTKYLPEQTTAVHLNHDIAVIPSIASEGTSLSVGEAMGAGCAVVATAVGGITNMLIDQYNGLLVMPNSESLLKAISSLVSNTALRIELGKRAYETAHTAFCREVWEARWRSVLTKIGAHNNF